MECGMPMSWSMAILETLVPVAGWSEPTKLVDARRYPSRKPSVYKVSSRPNTLSLPTTHAGTTPATRRYGVVYRCEAHQAVFEKAKKQTQLVDEENRVCIENQCCTSLLHAASLEDPTVP